MITATEIHAALHYNPDTGVFRWRERRGGSANAGSVAGSIKPDGYRKIMLFGRLYRATRLAWLYMTGEWPADQVDHRNLRRGDDRWANLREASNAENCRNTRRRRDNTSGYKGVYFRADCGKWRAQIHVDGRKVHLGHFSEIEDAAAAYARAARRYHGEFANLGGRFAEKQAARVPA